jgi:hypothetical protein
MLVHRLVPGGMTVPYMMTYENNARLSTTIEQIAWEPVAHYNNTLVLLDYDGASPIQDDVIVSDDLEVYTVANNVIHAPALAGQAGHVDLAPLDSAELFDARYLGRWEGGYDTALVTSLATPDGTASLYAPLPGSPVEGGATAGYVSLFDIVGKQRWPLATLGAVQVPSS